jgi:hypothetical protein
MVTDISNWLSLQDPRKRSFSIDLNTWDIDTAWNDPDTPPYDFRLSSSDFDPGFFDPDESFKSSDFFDYQFGGGRRDRVARFFNLATTTEPTNLDLINAVVFTNDRPNPIGNPWGDNLNALYDRYFFSTLPDPAATDTDFTSKPLLNSRLEVFENIPTLNDVDSAQNLLLHNGFNINSTSPRAWAKILSGHHFAADSVEMQYEQGNFPDAPEWFPIDTPVANVLFKFPEAAAFNSTERENSPRYEIVLRENESDYENRFRIDSINWEVNRQHPSFIQNFRELQNASVLELARAIVDEIRDFQNENGRPPFSLEEYISSGLLQDAINATSLINQRENNFDEIPTYVPTSIDQRAILNTISGFANVRSDSFNITARADVKDASGGLISTALCRARVQRLPKEHESPDFGRQMKIIELKWLTPSFD